MMPGEFSKIFFEAVTADQSVKVGFLLNMAFSEPLSTGSQGVNLVRMNVNAVDPVSGMTALGIAAKLGNVDTLRLLIDRGADIDARDPAGRTALQHAQAAGGAGLGVAERLGNLEALRLLRDRGATDATAGKAMPDKTYGPTPAELERFNRNIERLDHITGGKRRKISTAP